jgi:hypothetical protein
MHQNGLRPGRCRIFMRTEASWPEVEPEGKWQDELCLDGVVGHGVTSFGQAPGLCQRAEGGRGKVSLNRGKLEGEGAERSIETPPGSALGTVIDGTVLPLQLALNRRVADFACDSITHLTSQSRLFRYPLP